MKTKTFETIEQYIQQINQDHFRSIEDLPLNIFAEKRYDTKLIITEKTALEFLRKLHRDWKILTVSNKSIVGYETCYYDTPDFQFYRAHKQGKRKRFKIRIREYETGARYLELKLKTNIEETLKFRWPYPQESDFKFINAAFMQIVIQKLNSHGLNVNFNKLEYKLSTKYRRLSLVNIDNYEKITIDRNLTLQKNNQIEYFNNSYMILEVKSQKLQSTLKTSLNMLHQNRSRISKYGLAVPLLYPEMGANPWSVAMKKLGK